MTLVNEIRVLIAKGKTDDAINKLLSYAEENNSEFIDTVVLLKSRMKDLRISVLKGAISDQDASSTRTRIRDSVLKILAEIKSSNDPKRSPGTLPAIWNMKIHQNQYFTGREEILTQLHEALQTEQGASLTQAQVIRGLARHRQKRRFAVEYVYRHHTKYDVVWWIDAETEVTIQTALVSLTEKLGLPEKDANEQQVKVDAALEYLNHHPHWLLVFDNVESRDVIYKYRPQNKQGHVIITTRNQNLQGVGKSISIDLWTEQEAQTVCQNTHS